MPDRHAAHLYYLINVGGIIYHHGSSQAPETFAVASIFYPEDDDALDTFNDSSGAVSMERDLAEIETLARRNLPPSARQRHHALHSRPAAALLAHRRRRRRRQRRCHRMGQSHDGMHQAGALLCGYIDRPGTSSVVTLLQSIFGRFRPQPSTGAPSARNKPARDSPTATSSATFSARPTQQSLRQHFRRPTKPSPTQDPDNEVCFFYINPGQQRPTNCPCGYSALGGGKSSQRQGRSRLIIDQCRLLGDYPYVIARADEMAVVGRQDASELNFMIDVIMERHGISAGLTSKQGSKDLARGARTRHEGFDKRQSCTQKICYNFANVKMECYLCKHTE